MYSWHWHTWQDFPYLTCSILDPWAHGFFTQQFSPRSPQELVSVLQPDAEVYRVKQVHGNTVLSASAAAVPVSDSGESDSGDLLSQLQPADGLVTEQPQQSVWVCSADCTPVLIGDTQTGQVVAIHAGWRGTAAKIVPQAIAQLQTQGSKLVNLRIALGPAIAGEVYQVSEDVAAEVLATITPTTENLTAKTMLSAWEHLENPPVLPDPEPGRIRLDVRRAIAVQLEQLSISAEQVAIAPYCTYQTPEHFFSYRRDRQKKSAMVWNC